MRLLIAFALLICIGFSKAFNPSHSVVIHGTRFALLDDSDPSLSTLSCQTSPITIPDSSSKWKIASPNNPIHRMAVASYPWGTSCLVLDGGVSLVTQTLEPCGENHLHESNDKYSVVGCDQKILMYNTEPVNLASELFKCSSFTTAEGNCDSWEDSSQTIEITSGTLTAHAAGDDTVTVTQSVSVSTEEASNLNTGFTFSITTSCLSDTASNLEHPLKYEAKVSISYKKGDVDKVLSFTENVCNGAWSTKEFSLLPVNKIKSISVTFSFKAAAPATVSWKDFTILSIDNLIDNPSFHGSGLNHFPEWKRIGLGYMPDLPRVDDDDDSFVSSIFMVTSQVDQYSYTLQGAAQSFHGDGWGDNDNIRALYIGGWSKTYELTGTADDNFGIVADIEYEDGSCYGQALQFPTGTTNNWVYSDRVIQLDKPAVAVNITVLLRGHTGAVWLDGITFAIINPREQPISCNMGAFGDPRFKTIADEIYSFQTPGEYTLFTSSQDLIIQGRSVSFQQSQGSLLSAVAISGNSNTVSIQFDEATPAGWGNDTVLTDSPSIYVNGQRYTSPLPILIPNVGVITQRDYITYIPVVSGDFSDPDSSSSEAVSTVDSTGSSESSVLQVSSENSSSGSVPLIDDDDIIDKKMEQVFTKNSATYSFETSIQASVYSIKFPEGEIIVHSRYILDDDHDTTGESPVKVAGYLQVVVSFVSSLCTGSDGLFGNGAKNALTSNTGNAIDVATASYQEIQQTAETWRVTTQNSLFHYDDADADEFYHPSSGPLKVNEDVQCVHWAVVSCDRQALTTLNDSCIEDILLMKNNPFIVQNYHTIEGQLHLVTSPVGEIIGNDNLGFLADDNAVNPGSGFTLTIIISVSILVIICAIGIIYRRRKRQAKRTIVATDLELEDMLSENEKVEMFE